MRGHHAIGVNFQVPPFTGLAKEIQEALNIECQLK
jgi:hypothetical protein